MKKLIMAITTLGKVITRNAKKEEEKKQNTPPPAPEMNLELTEQDLAFILSKLRSATYTGAEFETFYAVWIKLQNLKPKK